MSRHQSASRRRSLLAGSSLLTAGLLAGLAATLAPPAASAQTCMPATPPAANPGPDSYTCSGTPFPAGISYTSDGGALSLTTTTAGMDIGTSGIDLIGTGADPVTFSTAVEIDGVGIVGPFVYLETDSGKITALINATLDANQSSASAMTHGLWATSTTGDIEISGSGSVDASSSSAGAEGGIEATTGGAGSIDIDLGGFAGGRLYGIRASTVGGTGAVTITSTGGVGADASGGTAAAAIDVSTGTGLLTIDNSAATGTIGSAGSSFQGSAIRAAAGGDMDLNLSDVFGPGQDNWIIDLSTTAGSLTTLNAGGFIGQTRTGQTAGPDLGRQALRMTGAGDLDMTVAATGTLIGRAEFGDGDAGLTIASGGRWLTYGASTFQGGDDTLDVAEGASLIVSDREGNVHNGGGPGLETPTVLDFGAGSADAMTNAGAILVGSGFTETGASRSSGEFELRLEGLETFTHSGVIMLGVRNAYAETLETDNRPDDIFTLAGGTFNGSDGLITFDVNLNNTQGACEAASRDPTTFDMPAADCVRISDGGSTSGVTRLLVKEQSAGDRGGFGEIVLVDVGGGTSAAGHFVLDPASDLYSSANGGVIDKGFFIFPLVYDPDTQQHKLVATPGQNAQQFPLLAQAAHGLWRLSTASWLDRQADLRGAVPDGVGGGVWMRLATEFSDRDAMQTVDVLGTPFAFDNTHEQSSYTVTGGLDVLSGSSGDSAWVLGATAGYVHSEVAYDASPNTAELDGWSGGGYASLISGGFFLDAIVNANKLILKSDVPGLGLQPAGTIVDTNLTSIGGQVEAGWRFGFMGAAFVEPLAGLSYVRTEVDDLTIAADDPLRPPIVLEFDDPTSLRASVGGRVGLDQAYGAVRAQYSLLGRAWNEFGDETRILAHNLGPDALLVNEFAGTFTEVVLGASVYSAGGAVSGFLNLGGEFGDDYQAQNAAVGVRVAW